MKRKVDRKLSSLNYVFRKTYWKLSVFKMPYSLFALISIGLAVFLLGGGVYDILEKPYPYWIYGARIVAFYPRELQSQLVVESITVMILYALGTLGLLMVYQSAKYFHRPRQATILLLIGLIFIVFAFILVEKMIYDKLYFAG